MHDIPTWLFALGEGEPERLGIILGYERCLRVAQALAEAWGGNFQCLAFMTGRPA